MTHWLSWHYEPGLLWVRLCGRGFLWKDTRRHPPTLRSERLGLGPMLHVGRWLFKWLSPQQRVRDINELFGV